MNDAATIVTKLREFQNRYPKFRTFKSVRFVDEARADRHWEPGTFFRNVNRNRRNGTITVWSSRGQSNEPILSILAAALSQGGRLGIAREIVALKFKNDLNRDGHAELALSDYLHRVLEDPAAQHDRGLLALRTIAQEIFPRAHFPVIDPIEEDDPSEDESSEDEAPPQPVQEHQQRDLDQIIFRIRFAVEGVRNDLRDQSNRVQQIGEKVQAVAGNVEDLGERIEKLERALKILLAIHMIVLLVLGLRILM